MFLAVAKLSRTLQLLMLFPPAKRQAVDRELGRDTTRIADPNWPNGYSIPYDAHAQYISLGSWLRGCNCCSGMSCHRVVSNCIVHHLFSYYYCHHCHHHYHHHHHHHHHHHRHHHHHHHHVFLSCPIKLSLSWLTSFTFFNILLPIAQVGGVVSEWMAVWCLVASWV